ncbi:MAG: hypothetical protein A2015_00050 [Spirochaetes bacterium GWF1_31_7]|nr:MAG: hypothetical protein A2Y30_01570 [Spirochaetes bacterium GWE1_32_154]OHD47038.1 MAG: hypothetical protein A2Y29_06465 [Spirochaetes bacterium GWE2_31_10]OHD51987.1 MAG: hypothetical protein A2015_00050 [Spirochaetes bacterium GWF1_31_7]HBD94255.1 hypothetical protein [Spirochaetia bacterium]
MDFLKVIFISIVQGIAEFLPISSSGHIFLLKKIFNLNVDMSFDIIIHLGTLFSIICIYFKDIKDLISGVFYTSYKSSLFEGVTDRNDYLRIYSLFIVSILPAAIVGFLIKDVLNTYFVISNSKIFILVGFSFVLTSVFLILTATVRYKKTAILKKMTYKQAFAIGFFQIFALLPGVSRAGATISGALLSGVDKKEAGRFSFLLSIPLIIAAFILELVDILQGELIFQNNLIWQYIVGFLVSFCIGFLALKLLLKMIQTGKIYFFAIYLIIPIVVSFIIGFSV